MENDSLSNVWHEWQIVRKIGNGSYGNVYEAVRTDHSIKSRAAIKIINIPQDKSEIDSLCSEGMSIDATRTYLQKIVTDCVDEIQLMESFKGIQNIVSVEDYKVVERTDTIGWTLYIRMELLTPLTSYMCDKILPEREVARLGIDICTALEICAKCNVMHRDIKPENILINEFGNFKLGDFGVARRLDNLEGGLSKRGTYMYMAPEVEHGNNYDATVDIYSLGLVMYKLMNKNRMPFIDTESQLVNPNERNEANRRRLNGEQLLAPCDASSAMAQIILCACAPNPSDRFASATAMKNALKNTYGDSYSSNEDELNETMKTQHCAKEISAQKQKRSQKKVNTFGEKKKLKVPIILVSAIVILVLAGVGVLAKTKIAGKNGDTKELATIDGNVDINASEIGTNEASSTESNSIYSEFDEKEIAKVVEEAEVLAGKEDYEGALAKIKTALVTYPKMETLQSKESEYTVALDAQIKAKVLDEAEEYANSEDYISAITVINEAIDKYGENTDYENAYNKYYSSYKSTVISMADGLADNGDYVGAIQKIGEATNIIGEDSELLSKSQEYDEIYVSYVISNVEALINDREYESAEDILNAAIEILPDNQQLKDESINIESSKPQKLLKVCPPYQYNTDLYTEYTGGKTFNMCGDIYTNGFTFYENIYDSAWAYFNLGGKYSTLEFDVGHVDDYLMKNRTLNIYYDGELAYTTNLVADAMVQHIILDISNVKQIRIEIPQTSDFWGSGTSRAVYGFANMVVYPVSNVKSNIEESNALNNNMQKLMVVCPPYQYNTDLYTEYTNGEMFNMCGDSYTDGFTFYENIYDDAWAYFNLGGKYSTLEFDVGHVDGYIMKDRILNIYLDGEIALTMELDADSLVQHISLDLNNAKQMRIEIPETDDFFGSGTRRAVYGFANIYVG
jgi:serine/threonine protein kinase